MLRMLRADLCRVAPPCRQVRNCSAAAEEALCNGNDLLRIRKRQQTRSKQYVARIVMGNVARVGATITQRQKRTGGGTIRVVNNAFCQVFVRGAAIGV